MMNANTNEPVPAVEIKDKILLTIREAALYSNIGINTIDSLLRQPHCPFVFYVGNKKLVKRENFEQFIRDNRYVRN